MQVLIIEDEIRAANRLERMLQSISNELKVIDKLESVREAVHFLNNNKNIDLIFSDIQLADGLCFEIYSQVQVNCPIVFTTAYDQYAIEAFNTNGIDYLLKPIEEERLKQALEKVKKLSKTFDISSLLKQSGLLPKEKTKERFMVKIGDKIKSIPTIDIRCFYSQDKANYILFEGRSYSIDYSLDDVYNMIDNHRFFKVNRKVILNIDSCNQIIAWSNSRLKITIEGFEEPIIVAREKVSSFKQWLDR